MLCVLVFSLDQLWYNVSFSLELRYPILPIQIALSKLFIQIYLLFYLSHSLYDVTLSNYRWLLYLEHI